MYIIIFFNYNYKLSVFIQLFLDQSNLNETTEVKPVDFFEQHTANVNSCKENVLSNNFMTFTSSKQVCISILIFLM